MIRDALSIDAVGWCVGRRVEATNFVVGWLVGSWSVLGRLVGFLIGWLVGLVDKHIHEDSASTP
jgi:hypothetical protein